MRYDPPEQLDGHDLLVEVCKAAVDRGWRLCANPRDRAQAVAAMEEVFEDQRWKLDHLPALELHDSVPRGRIGFFDPRTRTVTGLIEKVIKSRTGLGRVGKLWFPGQLN